MEGWVIIIMVTGVVVAVVAVVAALLPRQVIPRSRPERWMMESKFFSFFLLE